MSSIIKFDRVSKKYRLGLTRTSLPALVTRAVRQVFAGGGAPRSTDQVLWALRDVSFELAPGESMALVGPNGAGKSTLLKLLSKITYPTEGTISVDGRLSALIELGSGFHPDLTGRENIYLNGSILGLSRSEIARRFDEIVAFSELEEFIDTPIKRYSSGMEVRLGFSVASCIDPEILLVDEVLAVGDTSFREKSLLRIRSLVEKGTTIIFVSHNSYMVQAICRTGLYLQRGQVRCAGDVATVIQAYEADIQYQRAAKFREQGRASPGGMAAGSSIEIEKVTVRGTVESEGGTLKSHLPARLSVHYHAYRDVPAVNVAVTVVRADGVVCCVARSKLDRCEFRLQRGTGVLAVELDPMQLVTGSYFAEVMVTDHTDAIGLVPQPARSDWFMVSGRVRHGPRAGVFEPAARWHAPQLLPDGEVEETCHVR